MLWWLLLGARPEGPPNLDLKVSVTEVVYDAEHPEETWKRYRKDGAAIVYDFYGQKDDSYGMVFEMQLRHIVFPPEITEHELPYEPPYLPFLVQLTACYVDQMVEGIYGGRVSGDGWRIHKRAVRTAFGSLRSGVAQDCNPLLREDIVQQRAQTTAAGFEMGLEVEHFRENHRGQTSPMGRFKSSDYIAEKLGGVPTPYARIQIRHPESVYRSEGGQVALGEIQAFTDKADMALRACYTGASVWQQGEPPIGQINLRLLVDSLGQVQASLNSAPPELASTGACFVEIYQDLVLSSPVGQEMEVVEVWLPVVVEPER